MWVLPLRLYAAGLDVFLELVSELIGDETPEEDACEEESGCSVAWDTVEEFCSEEEAEEEFRPSPLCVVQVPGSASFL